MEINSYSPYEARIKIPTVVYQPLTEVLFQFQGVGCESRDSPCRVTTAGAIPHMGSVLESLHLARTVSLRGPSNRDNGLTVAAPPDPTGWVEIPGGMRVIPFEE